MVRSQKGFTIIELVVVIVILGILAAVAFPKFQNLSDDAKQAVVNGGKAAMISAAVITFAKNSGTKQSIATIQGNIVPDANLIYAGTCNAATVAYLGSPLISASVDLQEYCT